jgi:hypothetical protein
MIHAELRSHGVYETPVIVPQHMELFFAVSGNSNGLVSRTGAGQRQDMTPGEYRGRLVGRRKAKIRSASRK